MNVNAAAEEEGKRYTTILKENDKK